MDLTLGARGEALLRLIHDAIGILWVGCLVVWPSVGGRVARDSARANGIAPRLRAGAPSVLRWGAATTWVTGMVLTALVHYGARDQLVRREVHLEVQHGLTLDFVRATEEPVLGRGAGVVLSLAAIAFAPLAHAAVWRTLRAHARIAAVASYLLLVLVLLLLSRFFTGRAVCMHAGALLGTAVAADVWMRRGLTPGELARRSRHDASMAVPALLAMVATHASAIRDRADVWEIMAVVVAASWAATAWALRSATSASPAAVSHSS